ncbi:hypothetical protein HOLleu_12988 [Holothuria leucospilota]|uniref:Helitron helicase-like domain-containing protein n=1 Tax=Holothuria leucospilota TaxID=206669 RepID=A0A9Q1CC85_HOLLE|nr:hypothetical protein HOLleu_12988 [Holothuria leucospilota]
MFAIIQCQTDGKKFTAKQVLDKQFREEIINKDQGYNIFANLRNSPSYLQKRQKDLMAMIRQLGCPTYFMSLSAADTRWTDLIGILGKLIDKKEYSKSELQNMDWASKTRLIQSDPVTCVRFFDHRLQVFMNNVLKSSLQPIGKVKDTFTRIEFQQRGSPHAHLMVWIEDAPNFKQHEHASIVAFIDNYISCSTEVSEDDLPYLEMQKHRHSKTCRKRQKAICRFGSRNRQLIKQWFKNLSAHRIQNIKCSSTIFSKLLTF